MKAGWTQIGSKLPQEGQVVLVWDAAINQIGLSKYLRGKWCYYGEEHFEYPGVTHWLPAPEKPKTARS